MGDSSDGGTIEAGNSQETVGSRKKKSESFDSLRPSQKDPAKPLEGHALQEGGETYRRSSFRY